MGDEAEKCSQPLRLRKTLEVLLKTKISRTFPGWNFNSPVFGVFSLSKLRPRPVRRHVSYHTLATSRSTIDTHEIRHQAGALLRVTTHGLLTHFAHPTPAELEDE